MWHQHVDISDIAMYKQDVVKHWDDARQIGAQLVVQNAWLIETTSNEPNISSQNANLMAWHTQTSHVNITSNDDQT